MANKNAIPPRHTQFKEGQSGNPAGRPKKLPEINRLLANVLGEEKDGITAADAILKKLRQMATQGNLRAAEILLDRAYGKPKQTIANDPENPFDSSGVTLVFNAPNIEPVTSEAAMQAIFEKFKTDG